MPSRLVFEGPFGDSGEPSDKPFAIEFSGQASFDTKPKLANHCPACANAVAASASNPKSKTQNRKCVRPFREPEFKTQRRLQLTTDD
jgi:hypothetical protein